MPDFTSTALTDLDMRARGVPYDEFARLRRECPVAWFEEEAPNSGYWSVHRYQDIVTASRDVATFSSARGVSFEEPTDADMAARTTIIDLDPPGHTRLRKIVFGPFTQRAIATFQDFVRDLTERTLASVPQKTEFDFIDAVAKEVPIRVLARIMGLPEADLDQFIDLGDRPRAVGKAARRPRPARLRDRRSPPLDLPNPFHAPHRDRATTRCRETGTPATPWPSPIVLLSAIAAATSKIRSSPARSSARCGTRWRWPRTSRRWTGSAAGGWSCSRR
ncbi:MAG TPA: hypothetical protein VN969_22585 [Streptosporangiaceae bacterium]|nr:hypothetical protein [Streptosporangiaceae bacterium]